MTPPYCRHARSFFNRIRTSLESQLLFCLLDLVAPRSRYRSVVRRSLLSLDPEALIYFRLGIVAHSNRFVEEAPRMAFLEGVDDLDAGWVASQC